jgi:hypothetical protein
MLKPLVLEPSKVEALFIGTNFGSVGKTELSRRGLMVECVLKRAAGYHDGYTITEICKEARLLTKMGRPSKPGMKWAFDQLYTCDGGPTILERVQINAIK